MTIFILGCGIMQIPALRIARDLGWFIVAADGNAEADGRDLCDRFLHIDLQDSAGLIAAARSVHDDRGLDGVFTAGTDFSLAVAEIAADLDLPGHGVDAARRATDKVLMRRAFRDAGVPSPAFVEVRRNDDPVEAASSVPGPWVVKPVDSMGARGVVRIDDADALPEALDQARGYSRSGRALLETYMPGPEYSLDALVVDGRLIRCGLADRHIVYPPYFIEIGHTIPSVVDEATADALWEVFQSGIDAIGLSRGAAKGDVKLTPEGPMIGEIAGRLSGGYMSGWTWPYASGIEPTRGALRLAVGLEAGIPDPPKRLFCAERALIGIDGTVARLDGMEAALDLPGVHEVFLRHRPGDAVVFPRNNVEKAGNVIVTGADAEQADRRAAAALRALRLELDPADDRTGAYVDESTDFPPDAFDGTPFFADLWRDFPPRPSRGCPTRRPGIFVPESLPDGRDFAGRSLRDILGLLEDEGRMTAGGEPDQLSADFWKALIRGGLIGARWYLDRPG